MENFIRNMLILIILLYAIELLKKEDNSKKVIRRLKRGKNLLYKWRKDGVLVISGKGTISEYGVFEKKVIIENGITKIGLCAFDSCRNLESVQIANTVDSIGDYAFAECNKLQILNIPSSVKNIGKAAFFRCKNLKRVSLPSSLDCIEDNAFEECENIKFMVVDGSYAHNYVKKRGFLYTCVPEKEKIYVLRMDKS